ncbi:polysaccharide deacetylase family protein [Coralloluteibacterium thermophilus]|uniref:Polysaccharide deacetylase family protein n=1 Tax=Coralloluteibacterium thermophilum TaxID=2707049 RepID=A0ABV9NJI9_9GAMM
MRRPAPPLAAAAPGQRRRLLLAAAAHLPAAALLAGGLPLAAFAALLALHAAWLWGTLRPNSPLFGPVRSRLPGTAGVWLTIDDGPSEDTLPMLAALAAAGARATFFLVGERARARPDLVAAIRAAGHDIGNHSHSHPAARFWMLGPRRLRHEVAAAQAALAAPDGTAPRHFRAVVGHANPFLAPVLAAAGLTRIGWSARGYDAVRADVDGVLERIGRDLRPGAIVLLHEGAPHGRCVAVLEGVLAMLAARGLPVEPPPGGEHAPTHPAPAGAAGR